MCAVLFRKERDAAAGWMDGWMIAEVYDVCLCVCMCAVGTRERPEMMGSFIEFVFCSDLAFDGFIFKVEKKRNNYRDFTFEACKPFIKHLINNETKS